MNEQAMNRLAESARALAIRCRDSDTYRKAAPGHTFRQMVDEVLELTQHVSDQAVDAVLAEMGARPKLTFQDMKNQAAADLREVAKLLNARAEEVAKGDMDAFYAVLVEDSTKWLEMLALRQMHRAEQREGNTGE